MTFTRDKLDEAWYFLERMVNSEIEGDAFKYNLSAFLAAFRSVTYVMKKEFKECDGFCEWYNNMIGKLTDDELKLLRDKRIRTIHYEPVRPNANINLSLTLHAPPVPECSVSLIVTNKEGEEVQHYASPPSEPTPVPSETEATVQYRWYFEGIPDSDVDSDVVTVCRYGLAEAETIVSECEQKFSQ